jgi:hypothetical protein
MVLPARGCFFVRGFVVIVALLIRINILDDGWLAARRGAASHNISRISAKGSSVFNFNLFRGAMTASKRLSSPIF